MIYPVQVEPHFPVVAPTVGDDLAQAASSLRRAGLARLSERIGNDIAADIAAHLLTKWLTPARNCGGRSSGEGFNPRYERGSSVGKISAAGRFGSLASMH